MQELLRQNGEFRLEVPVFAKKHTLGKFGAEVFFQAWSTASCVVVREEFEFTVKTSQNYEKSKIFAKIEKSEFSKF